ncbi:hypothetical protein GOP47_0003187 [Adiantum capillus-veneris]|uniref:Uncharacterized protein n=1 Tax=Adiantum capillus-veneris TaxID=13818 RepID=A0A9D4VBR2_ADICA|nr:hypothetical protein GOP47_0003187 [Adiantum capillus-veneris]
MGVNKQGEGQGLFGNAGLQEGKVCVRRGVSRCAEERFQSFVEVSFLAQRFDDGATTDIVELPGAAV